MVSRPLTPFVEAEVIKFMQVFCDDKRRYAVFQAFFQHQKPSDVSVAILERVYGFEFHMEVDDVFQVFFARGICL